MKRRLADLEALLYLAGDEGLTLADLANLLGLAQPALRQLLTQLTAKLQTDQACGLQVLLINQHYKLTTKGMASPIVKKFLQTGTSSKLSRAALEVLAIVAYQQPITRAEIDELRGVNSNGALQTLIWRNLVASHGHKDVAGNPQLFCTTDYFLQYFGFQSLADLPAQEHFAEEVNQPGAVDLFKNEDQGEKNG